MTRRPRRSTPATPFPCTTRFRSAGAAGRYRATRPDDSRPPGDVRAGVGEIEDERSDSARCRRVRHRQRRRTCNRLAETRSGLEIDVVGRSEEHTSELQSLMRISYAVFCLKKKNQTNHQKQNHTTSKLRKA